LTLQNRVPESVAVVAFFESARMAKLLPPQQAAQLAAIHTTGGIPANWLAEALVSQKIPTTMIGNVRNAQPLLIKSPLLNVGIYPGSGGWPFVRDGRREERKMILDLLEQTAPEIVHAMWTLEGGRAVADWSGPKVLTVHDTAWDYARLGFGMAPITLAYSARWLANTAATLAGFQHVIAVSPFVEEYLRRRHRFRGAIRVIPNAIPEIDPKLEASRPFPKSGTITFGCYGGPGRIKNVLNAISALRLLQVTVPDTRLQVFGSGWGARDKQQLGGNGVEFRGALLHGEFLRAMAEEIDVWVHTARIEAHPITICEAVKCGCAVIAGRNSGGVAWTLDEGRAGMLVDVERPAEIAEAMRALIMDRTVADAMIAHGRLFIREHFSPEAALERHLQYYSDILNHAGETD
jgi:glycosyltransferase involved in cell wall biosynthesis